MTGNAKLDFVSVSHHGDDAGKPSRKFISISPSGKMADILHGSSDALLCNSCFVIHRSAQEMEPLIVGSVCVLDFGHLLTHHTFPS